MSVLIKGMEMPTSCWLCHFQDCGNCVLNNHKVVDKCIMEDRRDEDCPLIPVPPHGRLIDADALEKEHMKRAYENFRSYQFHVSATAWINEAPTIIPEEPPKEESPAGPYDLLYEEGGYNSNGV